MTDQELDAIWEAGKKGKAGTDTTCETDDLGVQNIWKSGEAWARKPGEKSWEKILPQQGNQ